MSAGQASVPVQSGSGGAALAALSLDLAGQGPLTVITVSGDMDMCTVHLLDELLAQVAQQHPERVVLDMAGVTFFCADGLRALIQARDTIAAAGGQLLLRAPSAKTRRVLTITRTEQLFPLDSAVTTAATT